MRAATAAAEPDDDPPGVWATFQGLRVGAGSKYANSVVCTLPSTIAPAARRRATAVASSTGRIWNAGPAPHVVGIAATRDEQLSYGVTSRVAAIALEGWGITLAPELPVPPPATAPRRATTSPGPVTTTTGATDIKLQFVAADNQFSQYGCSLQIGGNIGGTSANLSSNPYTIHDVPLGRQNYEITGHVACSLFGGQVCVVQGRGTITVDANGTYGLQLGPIDPGKPCQVTLVKQ